MRRTPVLGVVLAAAAGAVTVSAATSAQSAAGNLQQAQSSLSAVRDGDTTTEDAVAALRRAQVNVGKADAALSSWPVDVLAAVPVIGRSWDAERAATRTAAEVVAGALVLVEGTQELRAQDGRIDLAALARMRSDLSGPVRRGRTALSTLRGTSTSLTPPQVGRGVAEAEQALRPAVGALQRADAGLGVLADLLGASGPRSVLLMLQNNAELRGAGGYVSTFGTGRSEAGKLSLEPLQDILDVADAPDRARTVPAPAEYVEDYGPLSANTTMWRSWNMSPHVPDSALVGARIAGVLLGKEPDVVVLLDVPAMGALAALGGGAVTLPDGSSVSADQLTDALLVDAYAAAGADGQDQVRRRAALRTAATATVSRLLAGDLPAPELLRALTRLAEGRHVSVWSARPDEQEALADLGVAGAVQTPADGDLLHVSVNNIGGNKLDVYADRRVSVDVRLDRSQASVVQRVELINKAPEGLVPYVAGGDKPGTMVDRVELSLPTSASEVSATVDGQPWTGSARTGASRQRLAVRVEIPRGATTVLEVRYVLPLQNGAYRLRLVPQPLARDASLSMSVRAADGRSLGVVEGAALDGNAIVEPNAPFDRTRLVSIRLRSEQERSLKDRFLDFWNSPITLD